MIWLPSPENVLPTSTSIIPAHNLFGRPVNPPARAVALFPSPPLCPPAPPLLRLLLRNLLPSPNSSNCSPVSALRLSIGSPRATPSSAFVSAVPASTTASLPTPISESLLPLGGCFASPADLFSFSQKLITYNYQRPCAFNL